MSMLVFIFVVTLLQLTFLVYGLRILTKRNSNRLNRIAHWCHKCKFDIFFSPALEQNDSWYTRLLKNRAPNFKKKLATPFEKQQNFFLNFKVAWCHRHKWNTDDSEYSTYKLWVLMIQWMRLQVWIELMGKISYFWLCLKYQHYLVAIATVRKIL